MSEDRTAAAIAVLGRHANHEANDWGADGILLSAVPLLLDVAKAANSRNLRPDDFFATLDRQLDNLATAVLGASEGAEQ